MRNTISIKMWDNRKLSYSLDVELSAHVTESQFNKAMEKYSNPNAAYRIAFLDEDGQEVDFFYAEDIDFI